MGRCSRTTNLEVHHKNRYGGNGLDNAQVLCKTCHEATPSYGSPGFSPPEFSEETKAAAKKRAGYQCECARDASCH